MSALKYLSNFWRTLEMSLVNCEINFQLTYSKKNVLPAGTAVNQIPKLRITNKKLFVPVVTLSTQENIKLIKQLESDFKRTINWDKYHSKKSVQAQNRYLNVSINPSFQGVNKLFILSFEGDDGQKSYKQYYLQTVETKDYNVVTYGRKFFDQPIKNNLNWSRWWLRNWIFISLSLLQKILWINYNRFKQTTKMRCWSKSNTTNKIYWKSN